MWRNYRSRWGHQFSLFQQEAHGDGLNKSTTMWVATRCGWQIERHRFPETIGSTDCRIPRGPPDILSRTLVAIVTIAGSSVKLITYVAHPAPVAGRRVIIPVPTSADLDHDGDPGLDDPDLSIENIAVSASAPGTCELTRDGLVSKLPTPTVALNHPRQGPTGSIEAARDLGIRDRCDDRNLRLPGWRMLAGGGQRTHTSVCPTAH